MTIQPTHADIYREVGAVSQQVENLEVRAEAHSERIRAMEDAVKANAHAAHTMLEVLAELRADIAEIKAKVMAYDLLKARLIAGASAAAVAISVAFAAFWWLIGDKISHLIKGPTT
jgi:chromosome segregation ATPase